MTTIQLGVLAKVKEKRVMAEKNNHQSIGNGSIGMRKPYILQMTSTKDTLHN